MISSKFAASRPEARLIADSTLSFGMFTARAFWITRRKAGFEFGSVPPFLTAIVISLPMRLNCFAMRFHRANMACFLTSKIRPIGGARVTLARRAGRARNLPDRTAYRTYGPRAVVLRINEL